MIRFGDSDANQNRGDWLASLAEIELADRWAGKGIPMQVRTGGDVVFSAKYQTFDEAIAGLRKEAEEKGQEVPLYLLSALALAAALWILDKAAEKALDWALEARKRKEEVNQHQELCDHLAGVRASVEDARKLLAAGKAISEASRPMSHPEPPTLEVELETGAEQDLREGFEEISRELHSIRLQVAPRATLPATSQATSPKQ